MTREDWLEMTSRLAVGAIPEIGTGATGTVPEPAASDPPLQDDSADSMGQVARPTTLLWPLADGSAARFGVRVRAAPPDVRPIAARLVAAAIERNTFPVILSHVHRSGFEHLGFRVERIHAGSNEEAQTQEDELVALWNLAIVVELGDVDAFA